jgi:hypothetical protein
MGNTCACPFPADAKNQSDGRAQKILLFQQAGSGERKISGLKRYGDDRIALEVISIDSNLPSLIDDGREYLPLEIHASLVLDFLKHPDLSHDLAEFCRGYGIPIVASGKKHRVRSAFTPPICCALPRHAALGHYGELFGAPELEVEISDGRTVRAKVLRGSPCGATWEAATRIAGLSTAEAPVRMGLETQFFCVANPSDWDPISGKSAVHLAGEIHRAALRRAIKSAGSQPAAAGS